MQVIQRVTSGTWRKINRICGHLPLVLRQILLNGVAASVCTPLEVRHWIYRLCGIHAQTITIESDCYFEGSRIDVRIGCGTYINCRCFFSCTAPIEIGDQCTIAFQVTFCTSTHKSGTHDSRALQPLGEPIRVGNGCWIGANSLILPGVTIGDGCIIAAGAVVTRDCAHDGLYAGVPAVRINDLQ